MQWVGASRLFQCHGAPKSTVPSLVHRLNLTVWPPFRGRIRIPAAPHRSFMSHIECESVAAAEFGLKLVQERIRWIVVTVWIGKIGVSIL